MEQYLKIKSGIKEEEDDMEQDFKIIPTIEDDESDTETKLSDAISAIKEHQLKEEKRKKKKQLKERKKIEEKTKLDMIIPGDVGPTDTSADSLFTLKSIRTIDDVDKLIVKPALPDVEEEDDGEDDSERIYQRHQSRLVRYNKKDEVLDSSGKFYRKITDPDNNIYQSESSEDEDDPELNKGLGIKEDSDGELSLEEAEVDIDKISPLLENHLLTDLDPTSKAQKRLKKVAMWFDKVLKIFCPMRIKQCTVVQI